MIKELECASNSLSRFHPESLRDLVLETTRRAPSATALELGSRTWSYEALVETALRWASVLVEAAGGAPRRVGILCDRGEESYIAILSSLLAGATFVPLNQKFPIDRTRFMLEQADLDALIVDEASLARLPELLQGREKRLPVLAASAGSGPLPPEVTFGPSYLESAGILSDLPVIGRDDIAYILFTSGSTGRPKGVPIHHRNVLSFLETNQSRYGVTQHDRLSQTFDLTFDLSMFDIFMAWGAGATLVPLQSIELLAVAHFVQTHGITIWFSVPSVAALAVRQGMLEPSSMPLLRWSLFCGEALPAALAATWQAAAPRSVLENLYGPTELTIACSAYRWDSLRSPSECIHELVPIGSLYDGLVGLAVDESLNSVDAGQIGELCVAGPQTFEGYWRAPELTRERSFTRQMPSGESLCFYRTGDLVRQLPSNAFACIGRTDHQIKIGGYRIELGEIEAVMRRAGCIEAVALAWPAAARPESIVAFASGPITSTALRDKVRRDLPTYMVPHVIHHLENLPLNANGKVNRDALLRMANEL